MSYQAKDSQVLNQQLKVQELTLFANNNLISDDSTDLFVSIGETVLQVLSCQKQVAAGTLSGVVGSVATDATKIKLAGQTGAAATTSYVIRYVVAE